MQIGLVLLTPLMHAALQVRVYTGWKTMLSYAVSCSQARLHIYD